LRDSSEELDDHGDDEPTAFFHRVGLDLLRREALAVPLGVEGKITPEKLSPPSTVAATSASVVPRSVSRSKA
jgi:hypothetical protein